MYEHERRYRLFLIWLRDAEGFAHYQREVAPVARRYGAVERSLTPQQVVGADIPLPDIVNIAFFNTRASVREQHEDPDFLAVAPLRSASAKLAFVDGSPESGAVTDVGLADRVYLVELARFGEAGEAGYRAYEREAAAFMASYGYHVERVVRPDGEADGLPFRPDLVKVAYFDNAAAMNRMHQDPDHARFEGAIYEAAVAESLWLVARPRVAPTGTIQPKE